MGGRHGCYHVDMSKSHTFDLRDATARAGGVTLYPAADTTLHFEPPEPPGESFSFEQDGVSIRGRTTVAEVAPCVFVFTIYAQPENGCNCGCVTHTMVVSVKPESADVDELRRRALPPTEADMKAYRNWQRGQGPLLQ